MIRFKHLLIPSLLTGAGLLAFQNCSRAGFGTDAQSFSSLNTKYGDPPICDPLSGGAVGPTLSNDHGLVGRLIYESAADQTKYGTPTNIAQLVRWGTVAPATLYMSSINVPNRAFTEGFASEGQAPLTDASTGQKLVEWFGVDMSSTLKLAAGDTAGYYQFATITDDGSLLDASVNGAPARLVSNDGTHPMAAACSASAIYFDGRTALPIRYQYFQGPRTAIGSILAWRKVSGPNPDVSQCAQAMSNAGGWSPIPARNFFLPSDAPVNPCN